MILRVLFGWRTRAHGQRHHNVADELTRALIEADHRRNRVIWLFIQIEYLFHTGEKLAVYLCKTPLVFLPRLEVVFFNVSHTVL